MVVMSTTPNIREPAPIPSIKTEVNLMKTMLHFTVMLAAVCLATGTLALGQGADGAALFKSKCSACHGADGKGYAAIKTPDFTDPKWQSSMTDKQITDTIKNGKQGTMMPKFADKLKDEEIDALLKQIRSFEKK